MSDAHTVATAMLHIMTLDHEASVVFSEYTQKWLVSANVEIGENSMLTSPCVHRQNAADAVVVYFDELTAVNVQDTKRVLVTDASGEGRRHWRWNGAAFVQIPIMVTTP